jgi:hypothetical protein
MSTSSSNQPSSSTTGSALEPLRQTGTQLSVTGSGKKPELPRPQSPYCRADPLHELPPLIRPIVSASTARLLSWLRFGESPLDPALVPKALAVLDKLEADRAAFVRPATPEDILRSLEQVATTFQVELPSPDGLAIYIACLQDLPAAVLRLAIVDVVKSHTYRTMPLPGEFLATSVAKEWKWQFDWLERTLAEKKFRLARTIA